MNMKKIAKMYIEIEKALHELSSDEEEYYDLMTFLSAMIEERLEEYGITKYSGRGSPTEEVEYYVNELKEKYL